MGPFPSCVLSVPCATMTAAHSTFGVRPDGAGGGAFLPLSSALSLELNNVIHKLSRLGIDVGRGTNISRRSLDTRTKTELANPLVLDLLADVRRHYHIGPVDSRRER